MNTIRESLKGKTIFITGATGFLGQPLVEKILWAEPEIRKIYVLIRPKKLLGGKVISAQDRLKKELYDSSVFDRLRAVYLDRFESFLNEKLTAIAGDISEEKFGISPELLESLQEEVDIVINSAAVVSFDAPIDSALELNVFGACRTAEFANSCNALLIHVSTAYVCGASVGNIPEELKLSDTEEPFPTRSFSDLDLEISRIQEIIKNVKEEGESPKLRRELTASMLKRVRKWKGRRKYRRRSEVAKLKNKWLAETLASRGMAWARERGWNDTYTYTKSLGEHFVNRVRGNRPTSIIRPSIIESCISEPSPGWLDGLRMADPLIVAIGKGRLKSLPLNPDIALDLVPADMVVNALLAAIPSTKPGILNIYQVATGSTNPITLREIYGLIMEYFRKNPMLDKEGKPILVKPLRFMKPKAFRIEHRLRSVPLGTAEKTLERLSAIPATQKYKRRISATRMAYEKLFYYGEIYQPYLNLNCIYQVDNTLSLFEQLSEDERHDFNFDVRRLNWRHYIQNVHIPGVKKYILKIEGTGSFELAEEVFRHSEVPDNIPELLARSAGKAPHKTALQIKRKNRWTRFTYSDLLNISQEIARRMYEFGLRKGDRVVLFSENQPEWGVAYLGMSSLGLVVVPLDSQTWHREVWSAARFTEAKAILASEKCMQRLREKDLIENEKSQNPILLLNVDDCCKPFIREGLPRSTNPETTPAPEFTLPAIKADDVASIIFTTGTAVDPKGAVHTHLNFINNLRGLNHNAAISSSDQFLSVLPLYHALEFSCGFLMPLFGCCTVSYIQTLKPRVILETMRETGTTIMLGVPTLFALIREDIERRVLKVSKSTFKNIVMHRSKQLSRSVEKRIGRNIGPQLFARVHKEFGGRIRIFVSGGSALGESLYWDFQAMGMPIYEGYGLTETAPVLTVNPLQRSRAGSAGRPLPGVELRLFRPDGDGIGEIIVKSPSLMKGYFKNETATSKAIRDGWFHTGDLGWVDADGYIYITGRIKDVIVTGAGKNVYPSDLEAIYRSLPSIKEICVVGVKNELTEDVHAVINPVPDVAEKLDYDELRKVIQKEIQKLARELPSYNRLQAIHIWEEDLPRRDDGSFDRARIYKQLLERLDGGRSGSRTARHEKMVHRGIRQSLIEELSRLSGLDVGEITEDSHLYIDLGLDSLMAVELLLFLEREYKATVTEEGVAGFQTVGDVLDELRKRGIREGRPQGDAEKIDAIRSALPYSKRPALDKSILSTSFAMLRSMFRHYFHMEVENEGSVPAEGPFILAANHSSHLDTAAIIAALSMTQGIRQAQRLHVIGARDYFFNSSFKSWIFSNCLNVVPIERDEISLVGLRRITRILKSGEPVLIFPEGTRSRTGKLQDFKPGIGLVAWESKAPILPCPSISREPFKPCLRISLFREKARSRFVSEI